MKGLKVEKEDLSGMETNLSCLGWMKRRLVMKTS